MKTRLPNLVLVMSLLSLLGCSPTTQDLPSQLTDLRVKIEMDHRTRLIGGHLDSRQSIRAVISNAKGSDLERADVHIEVNGTRMRFRVGQGNYYDRHPYYSLDDEDRIRLSAGTDYRFVLILPDGTRRDIGTIRTPAALSPEQFDFAQKAPASGPVTLAWRDLAEPVQLRLGREEERHEEDGRIVIQGTGPYDPEALRRTIGPGWFRRRSDRWVLPKDFLISTADRKLVALRAEILATSNGRVSPEVSKQTSLQATRRIELEMEFATVQ